MNAKNGLILVLFFALGITACGPEKPTFEISGSPDPLFYGVGCPTTVIDFTVKGPAEGLKINSIIVGYNLVDGGGKKVKTGTLSLSPYPGRPPVWYNDSMKISVPDSVGTSPGADEPIFDFGEGYIEFAATVYAKILSPSPTGPGETYYFTSTESIPVLPCAPAAPFEPIDQGPGDQIIIITPPGPTATPVPEATKKEKEEPPPCNPNDPDNPCPAP